MAKFSLVEGDITILTQAYNGWGTMRDGSIEQFMETWRTSLTAYASSEGFFAFTDENHPKGSATVTISQFADPGAVSAQFGEDLKKLSREILKAFGLQVIRTAGQTEQTDRLLTLSGFHLDGQIRKLAPDSNGVLQTVSMYSLTVDDLVVVEEKNNGRAIRTGESDADLAAGGAEPRRGRRQALRAQADASAAGAVGGSPADFR